MTLPEQRSGSGDVGGSHARSGELPTSRPRDDESTSTPGAATSGLSLSEIVVGPTDENSAWVRVVGLPPISTAPTAIARSELAGDETEPAPKSL